MAQALREMTDLQALQNKWRTLSPGVFGTCDLQKNSRLLKGHFYLPKVKRKIFRRQLVSKAGRSSVLIN